MNTAYAFCLPMPDKLDKRKGVRTISRFYQPTAELINQLCVK